MSKTKSLIGKVSECNSTTVTHKLQIIKKLWFSEIPFITFF